MNDITRTSNAKVVGPIESVVAMRKRRSVRAITRTGGKPWTVCMVWKDGGYITPVRCEFEGVPYAAKTLGEAYYFRNWMREQFGRWCKYEVEHV